MGTGAVIALGDRLDVGVEEEALVFVDFADRAALAAEVTPTATTIAGRFRQPAAAGIRGSAVSRPQGPR
jgi:hypothetical protein